MKNKRILSLLFAALLALSLAACGSAENDTTGSTNPSKPAGSSSSSSSSTTPAGSNKEIILTENDNITVKVTGTETDSI